MVEENDPLIKPYIYSTHYSNIGSLFTQIKLKII